MSKTIVCDACDSVIDTTGRIRPGKMHFHVRSGYGYIYWASRQDEGPWDFCSLQCIARWAQAGAGSEHGDTQRLPDTVGQ